MKDSKAPPIYFRNCLISFLVGGSMTASILFVTNTPDVSYLPEWDIVAIATLEYLFWPFIIGGIVSATIVGIVVRYQARSR